MLQINNIGTLGQIPLVEAKIKGHPFLSEFDRDRCCLSITFGEDGLELEYAQSLATAGFSVVDVSAN